MKKLNKSRPSNYMICSCHLINPIFKVWIGPDTHIRFVWAACSQPKNANLFYITGFWHWGTNTFTILHRHTTLLPLLGIMRRLQSKRARECPNNLSNIVMRAETLCCSVFRDYSLLSFSFHDTKSSVMQWLLTGWVNVSSVLFALCNYSFDLWTSCGSTLLG